jgi:antitoxin YefM
MKTATISEFRTRVKELLEQVEANQDILVISGPRDQEGFVVLTMSHYEALEETAHLLSTRANTRHLMESIAQHKAGQVKERKLFNPKRSKKYRAGK